MNICVLIVTFNTEPAMLDEAIESVREAAAYSDSTFRVLIADNGSEMVPKPNGDARVLCLGENVGFGRAVNFLLGQCHPDEVVLVLNPDAVLDLHFFRAVCRVWRRLRDKNVIYSGWLLRDNGQLQTDAYMDWTFSVGRVFRKKAAGRRLRKAQNCMLSEISVEKVSGAAMIGSLQTFLDLGGYDDRFFLYGEDADLSRRARGVGVGLVALPDAKVRHHGAQSQAAHSVIVEQARADAAIRLAAYHRGRLIAILQRCELLVITVAGLAGANLTSSVTAKSRFSRISVICAWGLKHDYPVFQPK